jgi:hypothetical protein
LECPVVGVKNNKREFATRNVPMSSDQPSDGRRELSSWKEIADYFGVSVRTVQHWEGRGLPVRRVPGGARSRVFVDITELEEWKRSCAPASENSHAGTGAVPGVQGQQKQTARAPWQLGTPIRNHLTARNIALAALCISVGLAVVAPTTVFFFRKGNPAEWQVENNSLVLFDDRDREVWRKVFGEPLEPAVYDRRLKTNGGLPLLVDIDDDGDVETLFPYQPLDAGRGAILICYSRRGTEKWRFVPGAAVRSGKETFDPVFSIRGLALVERGRSHEKAILVVSSHYLLYPTQVVLLSPDGSLLRQYWHSGHIGVLKDTLRVIDFNRDGREEIYLCGVDNGFRQATLVVLDPESFEGAASERNPDHQLQGFAPGKEIFRTLFPKGCMNRVSHEYNNTLAMNFTGTSLVLHVAEVVAASPRLDVHVFYRLGPDYSLREFSVGDLFEITHDQLHRQGKLDHAFNPAELAAFRNLSFLTRPPPTARMSSEAAPH